MRVKCVDDTGKIVAHGHVHDVYDSGAVTIVRDDYGSDPDDRLYVRDYASSWWEHE
jgi:hypothetical protein